MADESSGAILIRSISNLGFADGSNHDMKGEAQVAAV
jgi:hypothetical protein